MPHVKAFIFLLAISAIPLRITAQHQATAAPEWPALIGKWKVSLRSSSGDVMGTTDFVVTESDGKTVKGTFYGSPLRQVHIATVGPALHFAFVTSDTNSVYHGAARFVAGRLEGSTHALDRGFLSVWTAERAVP